MSALMLEAKKIDFTFHDLPLLKNKYNKLTVKGKMNEQYKWKSLLRDRIVFMKSKPNQPIEHAKVTLTRCSYKMLDLNSLTVSFKHVVDALIQYEIIKPNASIEYKFKGGKWNQGKININVKGCVT